MKKLSESLETTTAKLEESKQLLKTNENGENVSADNDVIVVLQCNKLIDHFQDNINLLF